MILLRKILLVLIAVTLVGGTPSLRAKSMPSAEPMAMAGMPCAMMMAAAAPSGGKPMPPAKDMGMDCCKQMGCAVDAVLPSRSVSFHVAGPRGKTAYWLVSSSMAEFLPEPEPLPPRTI